MEAKTPGDEAEQDHQNTINSLREHVVDGDSESESEGTSNDEIKTPKGNEYFRARSRHQPSNISNLLSGWKKSGSPSWESLVPAKAHLSSFALASRGTNLRSGMAWRAVSVRERH